MFKWFILEVTESASKKDKNYTVKTNTPNQCLNPHSKQNNYGLFNIFRHLNSHDSAVKPQAVFLLGCPSGWLL
jgi:hypothetical protein